MQHGSSALTKAGYSQDSCRIHAAMGNTASGHHSSPCWQNLIEQASE
jgi:hypothetical protein